MQEGNSPFVTAQKRSPMANSPTLISSGQLLCTSITRVSSTVLQVVRARGRDGISPSLKSSQSKQKAEASFPVFMSSGLAYPKFPKLGLALLCFLGDMWDHSPEYCSWSGAGSTPPALIFSGPIVPGFPGKELWRGAPTLMGEFAKSMHKEIREKKQIEKGCSTSLVITQVEIKTIFQLVDEQVFF